MPSAVTRVCRGVLDPLFTHYRQAGIETLAERFGDLALEIDRATWSLAWEEFARAVLEQRVGDPPTAHLEVVVDDGLRPIGLAEELAPAERDGFGVAALHPDIWRNAARRLASEPPADRRDGRGNASETWPEIVDLLDAIDILALTIGEELRAVSIAHGDGDDFLLLGGTRPRSLSLPRGDPGSELEYVYVADDGQRWLESVGATEGHARE